MLLVFFMSICFFVELSHSGINGIQFLEGWAIPWLNSSSILIVVAQVGGIVMPHNLFLQSSLAKKSRTDISASGLREIFIYSTIETTIPILWSFFVNSAVIALASETFPTATSHGYGIPAPNIGLNDVCNLIQNVFPHSNAGCILWGIALFCAGLSASVTSSYAGSAILQGFWKVNVRPWVRNLYGRIISVIPGVIITVTVGEAGANTSMIIASAMLSVLLPVIMLPLIQLTSSKDFMGEYRISFRLKVCFILELLLFFAANLYFLITLGLPGIVGGVIFCLAFTVMAVFMYVLKLRGKSKSYEIEPIMKKAEVDLSLDVEDSNGKMGKSETALP